MTLQIDPKSAMSPPSPVLLQFASAPLDEIANAVKLARTRPACSFLEFSANVVVPRLSL